MDDKPQIEAGSGPTTIHDVADLGCLPVLM